MKGGIKRMRKKGERKGEGKTEWKGWGGEELRSIATAREANTLAHRS